jgi:hypothetical protein
MPLDFGYRPPPHTTTSTHPLVAPPCRKQEPARVLLSPFKMGATPSSLLPEMEALKLHSSSTVSLSWYCLPSLLHPRKGVGSLIICRRIHSPPSFEFLLRKKSKLKSLPPDHICRYTAPSYGHEVSGEPPCITATACSNSGEFLPS